MIAFYDLRSGTEWALFLQPRSSHGACLERHVPEMTCYVSTGTSNPTHTLTHFRLMSQTKWRGLLFVWLTASIPADSDPAVDDNTHLFGLQPAQLVDESSLGGDIGVKRAMSMLRMGRGVSADQQAVKKAMGMLRMGRSPAAVDADKRAMGMLRMGRSFADDTDASKRAMDMLRMGRAMGMLRMGRSLANYNDKRAMSMLRMGWDAIYIIYSFCQQPMILINKELAYSNMRDSCVLQTHQCILIKTSNKDK